jgi:imidazolonepropionase-like amidohydrolase
MIKVYSRLTRSMFLAIVEEASSLGLKIVGHVPDSISIQDAAAAGLDSSEHELGFDKLIGRLLGEFVMPFYRGMGIDTEYFARLDEVDPLRLDQILHDLRDAGLTVCPTIVTLRDAVGPSEYDPATFALEAYVSEPMRLAWDINWQSWGTGDNAFDPIWQPWSQLVVRIHEAGIPLMVGTDCSVPGIMPGFSLHDEMEIWQNAGIAAIDILRSATIVPAQFMEVDERLGSIDIGKDASMILLRGNPLVDIANSKLIEAVFLRGTYFDRSALDDLLEQAQQFAGS